MTTEQVFIVRYNDRFGNGSDTHLECIVKSRDEFYEWLDYHNDIRKQHDNEPEDESEFDLLPIGLLTFNL
jgi:hypothetical protein